MYVLRRRRRDAQMIFLRRAALAGGKTADDLAAWRARQPQTEKRARKKERKKFNCAMLSKAF
jgi:hypothetical protein